MLIILSIIGTIYFIIALLFFIGLIKSKKEKIISESFPFITVIIAARNEEKNLPSCLDSLKNIYYPRNKYEIFIVDDESTDRTSDIVKQYTGTINNLNLLNTKNFKDSELSGKIRALDYGISLAKGEIILTTDADCIVNKNWLFETAKYFDEKTSMVCGISIVKGNTLFAKIQSIDWLYLQSIGASSQNISIPTSCIGNNLSIRKSIYEKIGGYKNIAFSVTEDLALYRKVNTLKEYKVKYPLNTGCLITTLPCSDIKELYHQKRRWFRGGTGLNMFGYLLGLEMYAMNFFILFGWIFYGLNEYLLWVAVKIISDVIVIYPLYSYCNFKKIFRYFPLFQLYFAIYGLSLPFTFITGKKIIWKGRKH